MMARDNENELAITKIRLRLIKNFYTLYIYIWAIVFREIGTVFDLFISKC